MPFMKVLWLANVALPEASRLMGDAVLPFGGWVVGAAQMLASLEDVQLSVAFLRKRITDVQVLHGERITHYAVPYVRERTASRLRGQCFRPTLSKVLALAVPDIVVVFGTERAHSLAMIQECEAHGIPCAISLQGLLCVIWKHFMANLPFRVQYGCTLSELLLYPGNLRASRKTYLHRGRIEIEALQNVRHLIGRTTWDRVCAQQFNPNARYYHCNEILREEFYKHTWDIKRCERHSILVSQGDHPIKGLHIVLEALPLILQRFPEVKVYVAGPNVAATPTLLSRLLQGSYGRYLRKLIWKYRLEAHIVFTGMLDERQMCERFLRTHAFVSASTIENESNSLSEAKLLGVPCVASYAGGVIDRVEHGKDGFFYAWDAPYMLAHYACEIFANDDLARTVSENARQSARRVNDPERNLRTLLGIYASIISGKEVP